MLISYSWLLIIFAAIIWGIDGVLLTPRYFSLGLYDVKFIVFISHLVPTIILSLLFFKNYKKILNFNKKDYIYFLLISSFGGLIGTLAIVKALMLSNFSLSLVTLIQKSQPIFAILLAYLILGEKPKKNFYIVFFVVIVSLYFLIFGFNKPNLLEQNNLKAGFYSLIAAISFGSSTVLGRKIVIKYDFLTTTLFRFSITTILAFILLIFNYNQSINSLKFYISNSNLYTLTLIIAVFSLSSLLMYYKGMSNTKAIYATICELFFPITAVITEAIFLGHYLSIIQYFSALVMFVAIVYINLEKNN